MTTIGVTNIYQQEKAEVSLDVAQRGEVNRVMSNLMGIIVQLQEAIAELEKRLNPVLPQRSEMCDDAPMPRQTEYQCPLAQAIEFEHSRIKELNEIVRQILNSIEI